MKKFIYVGGPAFTGVTLANGQEVLLHRGNQYTLDETNGYIKGLLAKRNANGMPSPWLIEVPIAPVQEQPEKPNKKGVE